MIELEKIYEKRRLKLLDETIDVSAYLIWLMENYPKRLKIIQRDNNFQYRFK